MTPRPLIEATVRGPGTALLWPPRTSRRSSLVRALVSRPRVAEADDLEEAYRNILNYSEWIEYETKLYLTIEQALPHIADYVG